MGAPNELSFLPDDYLERKARRRTNVICAVLFCVVIAAIAGAFTVTERSMRETDKQYVEIQQQYTDAAKRIEQVTQLQEKQRTMAHQAELTASLLEKVPRSFILAEITNGIPTGVSLLDFQLDSALATKPVVQPKTAFEIRKAEVDAAKAGPVVALAQPRVYDVTMRLNGVAQTDVQVSQFITKLIRSTMFKDVNLVFTDQYTQGEKEAKLRKFQIEMTLNPGAQIDAATAAAHDNNKTAAIPLESK